MSLQKYIILFTALADKSGWAHSFLIPLSPCYDGLDLWLSEILTDFLVLRC